MKPFVAFLTLIFLSFIAWDAQAQVYGEPYYFVDFADGIPADWLNFSADGVSEWEYRGPDTDPDNSVCSRGSCGSNSIPPASQSLDNGFVIFDSNWWDEPEGDCGQNPGSGIAPGPHEVYLQSPSYDFSDAEDVVFTFQQQYLHSFTTSTEVQLSIEQGEWVTIHSNTGFVSTNTEWVSVNITEEAGGAFDVRVRFVFTGRLFHWALDDIYFYQPNENDVLISDVAYTDFATNSGVTGLSNLEYHAYPIPFLVDLKLRAKASNVGGLAQANVMLTSSIFDEDDTEVFNQSGNGVNLNPGTSATVNAGPDFDPSSLPIGKYRIDYYIDQVQEDQDTTNNGDSKDFEITEYQYGRDEGISEGDYTSIAQFDTTTFELGNIFEVKYDGYSLNSIAVALSENSVPGSMIFGKVYNFTRDTVLALTQEYEVNSAFLNEEGGSNWMVIPLDEPLLLEAGKFYHVQVGAYGAENTLRVCLSGRGPDQSSFLSYPEVNQLFFINRTPMVRMQVFPQDVSSGCNDELAANYDPEAILVDGSCLFPGCTNPEASNYDSEANFEDNSCEFAGCTNPEATNFDPNATVDDGSCIIEGCTDPDADNYNPDATDDDGSCITSGCTDPQAENYNPNANSDDGSCIYLGCTDEEALNYDPTANEDDGSCNYDEAEVSVSPIVGCIPLEINIQNLTEIASSGSCSLTINGETISTDCLEELDYTITESGNYVLAFTYTVGEFISSSEVAIEASDSPDAPDLSFFPGDNLINCTGCSGLTTEWYLDDELITAGDGINSILAEENGEYTVVVFDNSACSSSSEPIEVTTIDLRELSENGFKVYPNPGNGLFYLESERTTELRSIMVYDSRGRVVKDINLDARHLWEIDLSSLGDGHYILLIDTGREFIRTSLLIAR